MEWINIEESLPPIDREVVLYSSRTDRTTVAVFAIDRHARQFCEHYRYDYWIYAPKKEQHDNTRQN